MNNLLLGIIFFTGAECVSPIRTSGSETFVSQVPCATPIYAPVGNPFKIVQEPNTVSVSLTPPKKKPLRKKRKSRR